MNELVNSYEMMISEIGEDLSREGLVDTPQRAAEAFRFLTCGYKANIAEVLNNAIFDSTINEMVIVKNIELYSLCEHHLLPFFGKCHIGYLPNGKVLGLSKIARLVDVFARRLQIQESLTQQIACCIEEVTHAKGVGVIIEASHLCMMMRGVEKQNSSMITSMMLGNFRTNVSTRAEFLSLVK
jgi:GTP cyclohydrolase IA